MKNKLEIYWKKHSSSSSQGCGVTQMVVRWLAVRQARVRFSHRQPREVFPTELTCDEEKNSANGDGEMYRINKCVLYRTRKYQNKQKEWHHVTKLLKQTLLTDDKFEDSKADSLVARSGQRLDMGLLFLC